MAPGHTIPMVRMANLFSSRGVTATVLTTPINSSLVDSSSSVNHIQLPFPSTDAPDLNSLTAPFLRTVVKSADVLFDPVHRLLDQHQPDCVIADHLFSWVADLAAHHGIPWLAFDSSGFFPLCCTRSVASHVPCDGFNTDGAETITVADLPYPMEMRLSQLPDYLRSHSAARAIMERIQESEVRSYGTIVSSLYEMESLYADHYKMITGIRAWQVFPDSWGANSITSDHHKHDIQFISKWLDSNEVGSVVYLCFGSLGKFTEAQLREIARGLEASGHPYLWMVRKGEVEDVFFVNWEAEGRKGMIIRGWAPQVTILNHPAVGAFVTHCGWNSTLEGVTAGVPMITWPLFAEQFFNEKLIVDVLGIGAGVGATDCSSREEERTVVSGDAVVRAVNGLMGGGAAADEMRRRAGELGEKARRANKEGGSSNNDMTQLIDELSNVKATKIMCQTDY